ncbi:hypothetical protein MWK69_25090 [Escherichia coli]|nr:hypothetical protein [Escherichia coli]
MRPLYSRNAANSSLALVEVLRPQQEMYRNPSLLQSLQSADGPPRDVSSGLLVR